MYLLIELIRSRAWAHDEIRAGLVDAEGALEQPGAANIPELLRNQPCSQE
jgi:hypothetical protein